MRCSSLLRGALVTPFVRAADAALYFPRYHPAEHLSTMLPELKTAKELLLQPAAAVEHGEAALSALVRSQEIFENLQQQAPAMAKELRFVVASKFRLIESSATAGTGNPLKIINSPNGPHAQIVRDASHVLAITAWEPNDAQFDAMCVVLAAFVKSLAQLRRTATFADDGVVAYTPDEKSAIANALTWCKQLQGHTLREKSGFALKRHLPALRVIEALLLLAVDGGNMPKSLDIVKSAGQLASDFAPQQHGLFGAMQAEFSARQWDWQFGPGFVDEHVASAMKGAHQHYSALFGHPSYPDDRRDPIESVQGFEDLRDNFATALITAAQFYLHAPHEKPGDDWMPPELLSYSPIMILPAGSTLVRESSVKLPLPHSEATRQALHLSERALKVNRSLFPDQRDNLKAAEILRTMGVAYADLQDYLYATGMWNNAKRIYDRHYGPHSRESMDTMRLLERFQRKVGSTKEADATKHQMEGIYAQHSLTMPPL